MNFTAFCLMAALFSLSDQHATTATLPDYTEPGWFLDVDHTEHWTYKGSDIELRDKHYIKNFGYEKHWILVYYHPENSQPWFAIQIITEYSGLRGHLFERKSDSWKFIRNLSHYDLDDMANIFKSRYNLVGKAYEKE